MKFVLLIYLNFKLLTIANSFLLNIAEHEHFCANNYENANYLLAEKSHAQLNWAWIKFYNLQTRASLTTENETL